MCTPMVSPTRAAPPPSATVPRGQVTNQVLTGSGFSGLGLQYRRGSAAGGGGRSGHADQGERGGGDEGRPEQCGAGGHGWLLCRRVFRRQEPPGDRRPTGFGGEAQPMPQLESTSTGVDPARGVGLDRGVVVGVGRGLLAVGVGAVVGFAAGFASAAFTSARILA